MTVHTVIYPCLSQAAKRELERQRQLEWERNRRQELLTQRNKEQEDIVVLKAKKKTLEFELEALVSKINWCFGARLPWWTHCLQ